MRKPRTHKAKWQLTFRIHAGFQLLTGQNRTDGNKLYVDISGCRSGTSVFSRACTYLIDSIAHGGFAMSGRELIPSKPTTHLAVALGRNMRC
eukprot:570968-Prorocentrum_minimum.AAC.5